MQSIDSIETYAYGTSKDQGSVKEEIKRNDIENDIKITNFDDVAGESIKEHEQNWPQILDHPYRISIIEGWESGKTNSLFNLIGQLTDTGKIYSYAKYPY